VLRLPAMISAPKCCAPQLPRQFGEGEVVGKKPLTLTLSRWEREGRRVGSVPYRGWFSYFKPAELFIV